MGPRQQPRDFGHLLGVGDGRRMGQSRSWNSSARAVVGARLDCPGAGRAQRRVGGRVGQHPHGLGQGGQGCSGAVMWSKFRQRAEGSFRRSRPASVGVLEAQTSRGGGSRRPPGSSSTGEPVDGGHAGSPGDHVERPGADRGGEHRVARRAGSPWRRRWPLHQGLLVAALDERRTGRGAGRGPGPCRRRCRGRRCRGRPGRADGGRRRPPSAGRRGTRRWPGRPSGAPSAGRSGHGSISLQQLVTRDGRAARPS